MFQFVFLAVHTYFAMCLHGRQFMELNNRERVGYVLLSKFKKYKNLSNQIAVTSSLKMPKSLTVLQQHIPVPLITLMQFIFYLGWMKVAAALMNPFGEDIDDLEVNFLIDKNFAVRVQGKLFVLL